MIEVENLEKLAEDDPFLDERTVSRFSNRMETYRMAKEYLDDRKVSETIEEKLKNTEYVTGIPVTEQEIEGVKDILAERIARTGIKLDKYDDPEQWFIDTLQDEGFEVRANNGGGDYEYEVEFREREKSFLGKVGEKASNFVREHQAGVAAGTALLYLGGGAAAAAAIGLSLVDLDGDGLRDYQEWFGPGDFLIEDTDHDGALDGEELKVFGTDPTDPSAPQPEIQDIKEKLEENGELSKTEVNYIQRLVKNPHNIRPQILDAGFHKDGKITERELRLARDKDEDGAIKKYDPDDSNPDMDMDQLLDGWEIYGVKRENFEPVPLHDYGADPLHKDIFVEMLGENKLSREAKDKVVEVFANAPVSNPDGESGINIHIDDDTPGYSLGGENPSLEEFRVNGFKLKYRVGDEHPRYGTFHFGMIYEGSSNLAAVGGYNFTLWKLAREDPSTFTHELGHNILGKLDEKNQAAENVRRHKIHSKYENYAMWPDHPTPKATYHPNVWEEIDRDGILGLPDLENWNISYK